MDNSNPNYTIQQQMNPVNLAYQCIPENQYGINPTETSAMQASNFNNPGSSNEDPVYTDLTNQHQFNRETRYRELQENYDNHPPPHQEHINSNQQYHSAEFEEKTLKFLTNIGTRLTNIEAILKNSNEEYEDDFQFPSGFPLKTLEEFDNFDKVTNADGHKKMQNYLKSYGGQTPRDALNHYIRVVMTNTLAERFNWTGKTNSKDTTKRCFMDTQTAKIFWRALKISFRRLKPKISEFEKDMTEVLRSYKQTSRNARRPEANQEVRPRKRARAQEIFSNSESE